MKLNKKEILEYQQNRPPYLMIDFVDEVIPGKSAKGYKDLTKNEWFFKVHWPEDPNMPGMLQIESLVQMCALSLLTMPGNKGKLVYLISPDKIEHHFYKDLEEVLSSKQVQYFQLRLKEYLCQYSSLD